MFNLSKSSNPDTIVAEISVRDIGGRVENVVIEQIATRLADRYVAENAEQIFNLIGLTPEKVVKEVRELIKKRIDEKS